MNAPSAAPLDCRIPAQDLLRFVGGELRGPARRRILEHVLAGCPRCRESLDAFRELRDEQAAPAPAEAGPSIARILSELGDRAATIERERAEAQSLLADFLRHPVARQWTLVRNSRRFENWSFCAGLLDAAFEAMYDDPRRARELADMARALAERLSASPYGERAVTDLRGRAWAHYANARRALGELPAADEAMRRARALLEQGTGDPLDEAELLYFEASLLRARRELEPALRKIRRSIRLYRELGDAHLEGRSLINEASIHLLRADYGAALDANRRALDRVDPARDPHLALAARHNLVWNSMEAGKVDEARAALAEFRAEYARLGDRSGLLRLGWLDAKLLHETAPGPEAAAAYRATIEGFAAAELPYEVAMASLDLARLQVELGATAEVRRVAAETLVLFRALGVERESIATWLIFQQAAEAEAVTLALIQRIARYYAEARLRPDLRFEA